MTKKEIEWRNKVTEQKENLDENKKYILDPFVGYIEKKKEA